MDKIKIIKNRSDIGAGTRGSDMGIDSIEIAAINANNNYFTQFEYVDVPSENESIYNMVMNPYSKRIEHVLNHCVRVLDAVEDTLNENAYPIVISGDHSSALGTISGIKTSNPDKVLGVVWIDAHADMHSPYTSPSGNIHGMPLAAALGEDNMKDRINEVSETSERCWIAMKNLGAEGSKVLPGHVVYFGVRDTELPEKNQMSNLDLRNYKVCEIRHRGLSVCVDEAINQLSDCDLIYVSFDVDSMDCDLISYGTGTPVSKGFDQFEVIEIINRFIDTGKTTCVEFVEVNPLLDNKGNKMAETAFEVLDAITNTLKKKLIL